MRRVCALLIITLWLSASPASGAEKLDGNWNIKIKVGHVGEGLRMVVLQIKEANGKFDVRMSKLNGKLDDVDEVAYKNGLLTIAQGAYEYTLKFEGNAVTGKVVSPAGNQDITGVRQESVRLMGDEGLPLHREWLGKIDKRDGLFLLVTRNYDLSFNNAADFQKDLEAVVGKEVNLVGWWVKTKIKIEKFEARVPK